MLDLEQVNSKLDVKEHTELHVEYSRTKLLRKHVVMTCRMGLVLP